jgi:2-haloacid dehalogenase
MVKSVCFDLLTGLLDSWTLWNAVVGDAEVGIRWRSAYLQQTYQTGAYRPYEALVMEAAELVGLPGVYATRLAERYAELRPWPEVGGVLRALRRNGISLAAVTNCSERLGSVAVHRIGVPMDVVVTAERAGFYKPHPRPYLLALEELESAPTESLFVAGSGYDLIGASNVGIPTYWHNRIGAAAPQDAPAPAAQRRNLRALVAFARS